MIELFFMGGVSFMGILTLILMAVLVVAVFSFIKLQKGHVSERINLETVKPIGVFALVVGSLGQFIGLYSAFGSIEEVGQVSQAILAGGLKVSSITTIYGMIIFIIAYTLWFALKAYKKKLSLD